jgi:hypothetical protein
LEEIEKTSKSPVNRGASVRKSWSQHTKIVDPENRGIEESGNLEIGQRIEQDKTAQMSGFAGKLSISRAALPKTSARPQ